MKKLIFTLLLPALLFAQTNDPYKIIDEVKAKFESVNDYCAEIAVTIDVDFLQMPDSKAKVYFKKPDKFKMDSDGFAMLPKQSVGFSPSSFLKDDFDAIYIKADTLFGFDVDVVKVLPRSDSSEFILATLWIDASEKVLRKIETNSRKSGTFKMEFDYGAEIQFALPSKIIFLFNISDVNLPMRMPKNMDDKRKMFQKKEVSGTVIINYDKYEINKGISDEFLNSPRFKSWAI